MGNRGKPETCNPKPETCNIKQETKNKEQKIEKRLTLFRHGSFRNLKPEPETRDIAI